jgi:hypothetical protein
MKPRKTDTSKWRRSGKPTPTHREQCNNRRSTKLDDDDAAAIRFRWGMGESYRQLAKAYGVTHVRIGQIVRAGGSHGVGWWP